MYTNEKNIQMLIVLLKKYNIKKIVVSPGAMNVSFVGSIQNDDFFEIYSCVDERSACYMACGLSAESGEPVALSCTGATSSRNYMPGLTEAFYRKLPILAITSAKPLGEIGHNIPQVLDRTTPLNDIVKLSVQVPKIHDSDDEWECNIAINKALTAICDRNPGPVHINLITSLSKNYNVKGLPDFRKINKIYNNDNFPKITNKKVAIFVGEHNRWDDVLVSKVEEFCEKYNSVVLCDRTSNYFGKYRIMGNLICDQDNYKSEYSKFDLIVYIGNISGSYMRFETNEMWRVNPDGIMRDPYRNLTNVFCMSELEFFENYNKMSSSNCTDLYKNTVNEYENLIECIDEDKLPFSNIWTAYKLKDKIPNESCMHLAILNSLRSWNFFDTKNKVYGFCNTGGFGIDGMVSTLLGASLNNKNKNYYGIVGDLAFFYDLNALGNRYLGNNIRLLLINNGCGTEFHNYSHNAQVLGNDVSRFVAADGHFGNKSNILVKNIAESIGFEYISACNKNEFLNNLDYFTDDKIHQKPLLFEIYTTADDESDALKYMRNLKIDSSEKIKNDIKKMISPKIKDKLKNIMKK